MTTASSLGERLVQLVADSPGQQVLGSQLAAILRIQSPDFRPENFGCTSFREFVRRYASGLAEVGRSGGDIRYGFTSNTTESSPVTSGVRQEEIQMQRRLDPRVWKTFSSPNSDYNLFGHPETGALQVVPPGSRGPEEPWVRIPPCSSEVHLSVAKKFAESLPEDSKQDELLKLVGQPYWWIPFYESIKRLGLARQWNACRRLAILHEFEQSLQKAGVPSIRKPDVFLAGESDSQMGQHAPFGSDDVGDLRRLAVGAIEQMSLSELRNLNLPLGYVVDQIKGG